MMTEFARREPTPRTLCGSPVIHDIGKPGRPETAPPCQPFRMGRRRQV